MNSPSTHYVSASQLISFNIIIFQQGIADTLCQKEKSSVPNLKQFYTFDLYMQHILLLEILAQNSEE